MYTVYTGPLDSNYFFIQSAILDAAFMLRTFSSLSPIHVDSDCGEGGHDFAFTGPAAIFDTSFHVGAL